MKKCIPVITAACLLSFAGCAQTQGNNATTGAVIGGVAGAIVGGSSHNTTSTVIGTLAGALIGSEIGAQMDARDRQYARNAFYEAEEADVGEVIIWNNPRNGHHGKIIIIRDGRTPRGEYCREFKTQVFVNGRVKTTYTKACKRRDGTWRVIKRHIIR